MVLAHIQAGNHFPDEVRHNIKELPFIRQEAANQEHSAKSGAYHRRLKQGRLVC